MYDILGVSIIYNKEKGSNQYSGEINDQRTVDKTIYTYCRKYFGKVKKMEKNCKYLNSYHEKEVSLRFSIVPKGRTEWELTGRQIIIQYKEYIFNGKGDYRN